MMREITFREAQVAAAGVLKKIDETCSQLGIRYYMFYGTLIGAVRHHGIIPWDDDIDIVMLRPDYEVFKKYCLENRGTLQPFRFVSHDSSSDYAYMIPRVFDTRYRIEAANEDAQDMGVFVDVYIYDGMGSTLNEAVRAAKKSDRLSSLCYLSTRKRFAKDNTSSALKMFFKLPAYLLAKAMGRKYWMTKLERHAAHFSYETSKYIGTSSWLSGGRDEVYLKEWFEDPQRLEFENDRFLAPRDYDKILRQHYGDYMKLPDENNRQMHHHYKAYFLGEE